MRQRSPRLKAAATESAKDPRRSPLFHWLKKNHNRFPQATSGRRDWIPLLQKAVAAGVTDDAGQPPSIRVMRDTWRKVCETVAAEQAARAATEAAPPKRKLQPRDLPKDWKPHLSADPVPDKPGSALHAMGPINSGPLLQEPDYTGMDPVERKIARMKWSIRRRSS
jgi:hypothetical protein